MSCAIFPLVSCAIFPLVSCAIFPLVSCAIFPLVSCAIFPLVSCAIFPLVTNKTELSKEATEPTAFRPSEVSFVYLCASRFESCINAPLTWKRFVPTYV